MELPIFYTTSFRAGLEPEETAHIARALRMKAGEEILITEGKGIYQKARLDHVSEKKITFKVLDTVDTPRRPYRIHIAVAPTRKAERNEWMVEKMVELGVDRISFMKTAHTHSESFSRVVNFQRLERIAVSAMKQSRQFYLPEINMGETFASLLQGCTETGRFVAYVADKEISVHLSVAAGPGQDSLVLIGPEGDFSNAEIDQAKKQGFVPVSLGPTRLRTETAALMACHAVHLAHVLHSIGN